MKKILIVEDKESMRKMLIDVFLEKRYAVTECQDGEEALKKIEEEFFDVVLTDLKMPKKDGLDVLKASKEKSPDTAVIVMSAFGTVETAVEAMRLGAFDYVLKPFSLNEIEIKVEKALQQKNLVNENMYLKESLGNFGNILGTEESIQKVFRIIEKVAPQTTSVLILGESGTGKEVVAREIHKRSLRVSQPFIAVNCAALAETLLESELFGHEKGAFTGAAFQKRGRFELADGGTLFLDEIGEISQAIQVKLLRFLQEKEFERVGGTKTFKVDVRIIAATNRDIKKEVAEKRFRDDLYYRLNVVTVTLPPLRERQGDIDSLAGHFLQRYNKELHKNNRLAPEVLAVFKKYRWPGNIRELENVIERAVVLSEGELIQLSDIPSEMIQEGPVVRDLRRPDSTVNLPEQIDHMELDILKKTLEENHWNQTKTAKALGLKRSSLQYKMRKYGLLS
ncbi:MAG: sigma-54-dependent Fis family transcriptional regulator [Nitrospirae bacterium]|nr:sigma-54-dependent Fis family transcriptional regulator [Nitrospirota bacterium]